MPLPVESASKNNNNGEPSRWQRKPGNKRKHRTMEEKLRKYETRAEGHEFIPAMMHLLKRYCEDIPEDKRTGVDLKLAQALDNIPEAKGLAKKVVKMHEEIPYEKKRRAFSPKYLNLKPEEGIDPNQMLEILQKSTTFKNKTVEDLVNEVASGKVPLSDQCRCCRETTTMQQPAPTIFPAPFALPPPENYEITFSHLVCVDESDPEWWGSDEPYAVFGVITEAMAERGSEPWTFHSPIYEDVDDDDRRPETGSENLRIFGFVGPRSIDSPVLITAACFEHDLGDVTSTTNEIRTLLLVVGGIAASTGGPVGWVVAAVAAIGVGITYLVDLIGGDDQIGTIATLTLTEAQAHAFTQASNPNNFSPLRFDGGDADGIYDIFLDLQRT